MTSPIRLAIVEDDDLFRMLMRGALDALPGITVVGDFREAESAERELPAIAPDVVVLDIDLGVKSQNGVQLGLALRRLMPDLGILLLSHHREPEYLLSLPSDQTRGWSYLLKSSVHNLEALERAIRGAAAGMVILDPELAQQVRTPTLNGVTLSERRFMLLHLIAQGYSNRAIAERMYLSLKTVENMVGKLYGELGLNSCSSERHARVEATLLYLRHAVP
jgi:Response regulator containing a CheY-like receiver domain and an HTH DNA-binding domain